MRNEYAVILCRAWMNESGHGFNYTSDLVRFIHRSEAIAHGLRSCDSDDFNIGTLRGKQLVATGWMYDDFPADEDDLPEIARQLCLEVSS